ncbi:membrane protein [Leuconostoc lactis]|uniref:YhgE/Pip family protein n=1 Tax=Leuconostoc lactis TaxID=1246 RepID=UPI0011414312|nr:YhgE/Pip domain-containing protein [Leuconostoc lactis]GEB40657.1 membrane protein [Leuconostoc lactis]GLY45479.1 membrane protein [Leuconostoc lactis]
MKFWQSEEWQRIGKLRGLKLLLVGIAMIPSIYAVIFLSSLWDTYGRLDHLPVAIVNNDQPTKINDKTQHLGQDLTDKLLREQPLKLREVSSQQARDGLTSGRYYMTITIPKNFTRNAGTLLSDQPKYAKIAIAQNAGQSFIAEKMTSSAAVKIQDSVNRSLQSVYNKIILSATAASQKGFLAGSDGARQLNNGLGQLADGSRQLNNGAQALSQGTSTLATGLAQYTQGVVQANGGAGQLVSGAATAANGANQLAAGTSQLAQNAPKLAAGSQQVADGAQQLATKLQELSDGIVKGQTTSASKLAELEKGLAELANAVNAITLPDVPDTQAMTQAGQDLQAGLTGASTDAAQLGKLANDPKFQAFLAANPEIAQQFIATTNDLKGHLTQSGQAAASLANSLAQLKALLPQLDGFKTKLVQLQAGVTQAQAGNKAAIDGLNGSLTQVSQLLSQQFVPAAQQLATGAGQVNAGQQQVTTAAAQLQAGAGQLAQGNGQLAAGATQLNRGLGQLTAKNGQLTTGAGQLDQGAQQLTTGTAQAVSALGQAQDGTMTLAAKLADGAIQLEQIHSQPSNVKALTQPVKQTKKNYSNVENNGTGMTPYMMSVGLFVGMITFSAIYDFVTVAKKPRSGFAWWADKQTVNIPVWIAQALIITTLLLLVDGLHPENVAMLYVVALVVAFAFNQFVLLFSIMFGKLGSGLMIVALVLQLSASAGSYPIELSNGFFQAIHPWMPMTYSVHAFREVISIGGHVGGDLAVLLTIGVVSMVLTWGVYHWKLQHNALIWPNQTETTN